ncbi:MAG: hypothetical protein ABS52_06900 [Gemmatimonadetes bacterium SCN 70-22]|nr:MAG: hypothetical protein ABS52_06900 [Gemmatimonadetes bacterium SCN 70-22]
MIRPTFHPRARVSALASPVAPAIATTRPHAIAASWLRFLLPAVAFLVPLQLAAQSAAPTRTIVSLADSLPIPNAQAVVLFHAPPSGDNVILLPRATVSANALGAALKVLRKLDREHGGSGRSAMIPIEGILPPRNQSAAERASLRAIIAEVAQQPMTRVGSLGMGQWMPLAPGKVQLR